MRLSIALLMVSYRDPAPYAPGVWDITPPDPGVGLILINDLSGIVIIRFVPQADIPIRRSARSGASAPTATSSSIGC
jgi:hypothetical protein